MRSFLAGSLRGLAHALKREPVLIAAIILGGVNAVTDLSSEQQVHLTTLVESAVVLLVSVLVRSRVTPMEPKWPPASERAPVPDSDTPTSPATPVEPGGLPPSRRG